MDDTFPLKGYTLPLSPAGRASLVDPPPWHYGGEVMHLVYRGREDRLKAVLPPPLRLAQPAGGLVWFVEWISMSAAQPDLAYVNPERAIYHECIVMVACEFEGVRGYYVPYIWVDNDFTLMRGFVQGFPKKLGRIHMTRLNDLTPVVGGKKPGAKLKGICAAHEERIVEGSLVLRRQIPVEDLPPVKFYLMRHFPDWEDPDRPSVHELTTSIVTDVKVADVWMGEAHIHLMASAFEETGDLGPIEAVMGYTYRLGMTIAGGRVLHKYV